MTDNLVCLDDFRDEEDDESPSTELVMAIQTHLIPWGNYRGALYYATPFLHRIPEISFEDLMKQDIALIEKFNQQIDKNPAANHWIVDRYVCVRIGKSYYILDGDRPEEVLEDDDLDNDD
jgi:hypothetical protein